MPAYVRTVWQFPFEMPSPTYAVAPQSGRYIPPGFSGLDEAVRIVGTHEINGWQDDDVVARLDLSEPDRWTLLNPEGASALRFSSDGTPQYVHQGRAWDWWQGIEPELIREWLREKEAAFRSQRAVNALRDLLAAESISAMILTRDGLLLTVPAAHWRSEDAPTSFSTPPPVAIRLCDARDGQAASEGRQVEGMLVLQRGELVRVLGTGPLANTSSPLRPGAYPYLEFMMRAAAELDVKSDERKPSGVLQDWLRKNWPPTLGDPSPNKIKNMATFLRKPEHETGGNLPSKRRPTK